MKIENPKTKELLNSVGLGLTLSEARELRDSLEALLEDAKSRHEHVSSADQQQEITVWIDEHEPGGS